MSCDGGSNNGCPNVNTCQPEGFQNVLFVKVYSNYFHLGTACPHVCHTPAPIVCGADSPVSCDGGSTLGCPNPNTCHPEGLSLWSTILLNF